MFGPGQRFVTLHIEINISVNRIRDFAHPLGSTAMLRRSHARVPSMLAAQLHNLIRIGGDDNVVQERRRSDAFVHSRNQRFPGYLPQHFLRQPGRCQSRRNDCDYFHAISVNFLLASCNSELPRELELMLRAVADGNQENCALAFGVWGEKADYVVVVKSETGRAQTLRISGQVQLAAEDASFELHRPISAVAKAPQNRMQVRQKENVYGGIGG